MISKRQEGNKFGSVVAFIFNKILILCGCLSMRSHVFAFVTRNRGTFRRVLSGNTRTTVRPTSTFQRVGLGISDYTVLDDDDDEHTGVPKNKFAPPDYAIDDDDEEEAEFASSDIQDRGDKEPPLPTRRSKVSRQKVSRMENTSWMDKNQNFSFQKEPPVKSKREPKQERKRERRDGRKGKDENQTFRDNFRGTRVFVQGLNLDTSWQDLKDHFRVAGEVVFASISVDGRTGQSKGCGVVQYETVDEAENAIRIMRDHPLAGATLYVREDVQEKAPRPRGGGNTTPPSKWKCANEDNTEDLTNEARDAILTLIKARDQARRRRNYEASDDMREELKYEYGVHLDDRLKLWWTDVNGKPPEMISDMKGQGRWGDPNPWRQIPTTPESDACVDPDLVEGLLKQRDIARREKDFDTADRLLEEARTAPDGDLYLRIHDESRTWRIWTDSPPQRQARHGQGAKRMTAAEQCIEIVSEHAPEKIGEVRKMLEKFPGREYNILKKLKQR